MPRVELGIDADPESALGAALRRALTLLALLARGPAAVRDLCETLWELDACLDGGLGTLAVTHDGLVYAFALDWDASVEEDGTVRVGAVRGIRLLDVVHPGSYDQIDLTSCARHAISLLRRY